ncbi:peptide chain release factor N(5)-glutamine methyltransferase [Tsuneonella mangrovi]|uniref:peptide chain release factor N(5)-glutamine methyltransferase n=1 Tax=Tsuneonella mangrovi TaxID=1982042 RepID=UPI000BA2A26D|nr:peptide chain release factor N(5)-glutamine methyltransferase [Tsuneonella mangrovi]
MTTAAEALRDATAQLEGEWARSDAELLMAHALGVSRSDLLLRHMRDPVPGGFEALLDRRLAHEPIAYILGSAEFYGRRFTVTPDVLIPRGDSETVVAAALEACPAPRRVLDCGTGSGALLLTILAERPKASGVGIDRAPAALAVARENAAALGLGERADLHEADWAQAHWANDLGTFDLVIANPPYVEDDAPLDPSVRDFEPAGALFAGPNGLDQYRILVPQLSSLLETGGVAVLEIGANQAESVAAIARESGFAVQVRKDLANRDRALILT